jgi:hypothetical protein
MPTTIDLIRQGRNDEIWTKHCGFLDLKLDEFMGIQERLLLEQIGFLSRSEIGRKLIGEVPPASITEFRRRVPLTTYHDYEPYLKGMRSDSLPVEPYAWGRTSGRSGEYSAKWAPYSKRMYDSLGEVSIGAMLMASCTRKGEVNLHPGNVILLGTAPPPYTSGLITHSVADQLEVTFVPSLETGEKMDFGERIAEGFKLGMGTGLDFFYGLSSILAKTGQRFESGSGNIKFSPTMLRPSVIFRLLKGFFNAKLNKRNVLPKDIWKLKGIMSGGTDTDIYRERIKRYWGKEPLEGYACTEGGNMAMQAWNFKGMTFFPDCNFLEFIPYEDHIKNKQDPRYQPPTVLSNELQPGIYELVFTNLLGGVFTRYRVGDLFEVISLRDEELNIDLPQVRFYSRADDIIDLGGFTKLTERSIWQVIEASKIDYVEWTARKEQVGGEPILHLYIELSESDRTSSDQLKPLIHAGLHEVNSDFTDLEYILGSDHLLVTRLANNSFTRYMEDRRRAGSDLAHVKPPHMQPSNDVIKRLLQVGQE